MTSNDVEDVANLLSKAQVNVQHEICFPGKGLKINTKEDVKNFIEEIKKCNHMTALRLEGNSFGVDASAAIGAALKDHPEFEKAYWSDMFTGRLKNEIPNALEHLGAGIMAAGAGLVELELSDNAFGPNGLRGLVTFLKSASCYTLRELKLNNNGLGVFGGRMLADCLIECHDNSCKAGRPLALKVFVSGRNRLENEGAMALSRAFKAIGTLEEITMLQNFIQHEGVTAIAQACLSNKRLRVLNLNDNTFTEIGSTSMAKVLPELPDLEVINFGDCLMRTDGAKTLATAISHKLFKLKELLLNGNEIGQSAIDELVECSRNKKQLEMFNLNSNEFGSEGVERLQALMEESGTLEALSSLSDDEGDDEDDDYDDDDDEDDNDSTDSGAVDDITNTLQVTGVTTIISANQRLQEGTAEGTVTVAAFLQDPTPVAYTQLGRDGRRDLLASLQSDAELDVDAIVRLFVTIAQTSRADDAMRLVDIHACTDELLGRLFRMPEANPGFFINCLLCNLGLIKHEDKKFVGPANIGASLSILSHNVRQAYFTKSARAILHTFIDRPHPLFDKCNDERHELLQTLYSL